MKALLVPKAEVEPVRKKLLQSGLLDTHRKITRNGDLFEVPVLKDPGSVPFLSVVQHRVDHYEPALSLNDLMRGRLDEKAHNLLPRSWQVLGNIVITSLHSHLFPARNMIGKALLGMYPSCKSVYLDAGIEGDLRVPRRELIAVKEGTIEPGSTVHKENGCLFNLDVTRIMFSKGNLNERIRMAGLGRDEYVVDMFAGIGYFSIPMAVHARPQKIRAIELNPDSHQFLIENIKLNCVDGIIEPVLGDCARETPIAVADRVVMGYVGNTWQYLHCGIRALKPGGVLHFHETVPIHQVPDRVMDWIEHEARIQGRIAEMLDWRRVKKYAPGMWHVVVDARIW